MSRNSQNDLSKNDYGKSTYTLFMYLLYFIIFICFYLVAFYAVVCDDPTLDVFQNSANFLQQVLGVESSDVDRAAGTPFWGSPVIGSALKDHGVLRQRIFTVATVSRGCFAGRRAVGVGTNQEKLRRAANLALVLSCAQGSNTFQEVLTQMASSHCKAWNCPSLLGKRLPQMKLHSR